MKKKLIIRGSRKTKKGSTYLILALGIVIVISILLLVSYKYNIIFGCKLVQEKYNEFGMHLLGSLYAVNRLDEGMFKEDLGDNFRFLLTNETLEIYYEGACRTNTNHLSLIHGLKNVITSTSSGNYFCVQKTTKGIKLCSVQQKRDYYGE